jgi:hypothetical protein
MTAWTILIFDLLMLHFLYVAVSLVVGTLAAMDVHKEGKSVPVIVVASLVYAMFWLPLLLGKIVSRQLRPMGLIK